MADITAQAVNEFRKRTGLGLMECKALLKEADGDLKKAELMARERGVLKAASRAGRATEAGRVESAFAPDGKAGALIELDCETDFVARNDEFRQAARDLAEHVLQTGTDTPLLEQAYVKEPSKSIQDVVSNLNARTGENVALPRAARFAVSGHGRVEGYIHHNAKSGALVQVDCQDEATAGSEAFAALCKDLALQIVAMKPLGVRREDVPAAAVEEQRRIFAAQVESQQGEKPQNIREKIVEGKLNGWFADQVLLDQLFAKDGSKKVGEVIAAAGKGITVARFARFVVGEAAEA